MFGRTIGMFVIGSALLAGTLAVNQAMNRDVKRAHSTVAQQQPLINSIRGDNLYKAYCASCHGEDAKGNGPMAAWLKIPPSDLTRISARNGGTFPLERIDRIISGEEALPSGHGTRAMPVWVPSSRK